MKGYIVAIIGISVIVSLISMLTPEGEGGGISRNIKLLCGLCVVLVSIGPIIDIAEGIKGSDFDSIIGEDENENEYQDIFDSSYTSAELENLRIGIKHMLSERFGIDVSESAVSLSTTENESGKTELTRIFITLYGSAIFKNTGEIEDYLSGIFGCEIVTAIG